ncbi:Lsr2 family protein [Actinomycetospora sp. OC33-EN08]|uniref:Lsr2 family protein n=1 Tax=Actinomycetospora aurantiaca TaxID=3129233 RepID=A0ABU8MRM8_9PSEU
MATRTTVTLVDDIDGSTADETVGFGLDGASYEIDLTTAHAGDLRSTLEPYLAAARRTGGRRAAPEPAPGRTPASSNSSSRERNQEIRAWADEHGASLSARGRLPAYVIQAFEAGDASLLARPTSEPEASAVESQPESATETVSETATDTGTDTDTDEQPRGRDGLTAPERETIRAWAVDEGIEVKPRGQLKKDLIANYNAWAARQG